MLSTSPNFLPLISRIAALPNFGTLDSTNVSWFGQTGKRGTFPKDNNTKKLLSMMVIGRVSSDVTKMLPNGSFSDSYPPTSTASLHWRFELTATGENETVDSAFNKCIGNITTFQNSVSNGEPVANLISTANGQHIIRCKKPMFTPTSQPKQHVHSDWDISSSFLTYLEDKNESPPHQRYTPYSISVVHNGLPGDVDFRSSKVRPEDVQDLIPDSLCFFEFTISRQTVKKTISLNSEFTHVFIICPNPASSLAMTAKYADFFRTPTVESDTESSVADDQLPASPSSSPTKRKRDEVLAGNVDEVDEDDEREAGTGKKAKHS